MFHSPRIRFQVGTSSDGKVAEHVVELLVITLILRGKTDPDSFLGKFWDAWKGKAWEASDSASGSGLRENPGVGSLAVRMPVVGLAGILRKEQEMWENTDKSLQDAFLDLNSLMSKAKEMVLLAEKMRFKLPSAPNNQAAGANDDELVSKEEIQDWLLSVGIVSPVTKESAGALYHQQLSRQVFARVKSLMMKPEALLAGISSSDAAITLGVAPAMAKEYLFAAEGLLCRDVSPDGFRFYINLFLELNPENIYLVKDHSRYEVGIGAASSSWR